LVDDVEALRKVDSHEEERRLAKSRRQSGDKTKNVKKTSKVTKDKSVRKDDPAYAAPSSSSDDSASGSSPTSSDDDNPNATDTSSSDDGHGPPGPPSPLNGSSPSDSSSESDAAARKCPAPPTKRKERLQKADRIKVIRPAYSRFKTLLDCRTNFLMRRQLTYTPNVAQPRSHGPEEGSNPPRLPKERAPFRITRSGKRGRRRYKTKGTVYLPATTVPPTVVALRPKSGGNRCEGPMPLMGIGPGRRPTNTTKYITRQFPQCHK